MASTRSLGVLTLDLVAKVGGFEQNMDRAARAAERRSRQISRVVSQIGRAFAAATATAATALAYLSKQAINTQDTISKLSQTTGISTETLSQLSYSADLSGVSIEEVSKGLNRLARNASDAARGLATPKRAFDSLGISAQNTDGSLKNTEELMLEVADRFAAIEDGAAKAALAQELFGRAGANMIPFLNQGRDGIAALNAEADQFGLTISTKAGKEAEAFNDNLTRLGSVSKGIVNQFAQEMLPMLVTLTDRFVSSAKEGGALDVAVSALAATFKTIVSGGVIVTSVLQQMGIVIASTAKSAGRSFSRDFVGAAVELQHGFEDARANVTDDIETIAKIWSDLVPEIESSTGKIDDALKESLIFGDDGKAAAAAQKTADSALDSIRKLAEGLEQQIATYDQGAAATIAYRIAQGDLAETFAAAGDAADPYRQQLLDLTQRYEELTDATKAQLEADAEQAKILAEVAGLYESTRTPLEQFTAQIERLNELRDTPGSGLDPETYRRAAEAAQDSFEKATKEVNAFAEQATRNTQDIIARNLRSGFDEGTRGILQSFGDMISDLGSQALAANISGKLFGTEGIGSGGGALGGFFDRFFGGARAGGGGVQAGRLYRVNEDGVEGLRIPGRQDYLLSDNGGEVIPNSRLGRGGQAQTFNNTFNVQGRMDNRTVSQLNSEQARRQRIVTARLG